MPSTISTPDVIDISWADIPDDQKANNDRWNEFAMMVAWKKYSELSAEERKQVDWYGNDYARYLRETFPDKIKK